MKHTYDLVKEPKDYTYKKLILYALKYCSTFQFIKLHRTHENESVLNIIKKFHPYLISITEASEWPGTKLYSTTATVFQYKFNPESSILLVNSVKSLYSWNQPDFPEDLCLMRSDGSPWLATIAHEKDGYFELTSKQKGELQRAIPDLVLTEHEITK